MRAVFAALAGGVFGAGLLISGMIDTLKVQGFLDFFGAWDATLAFVMGGAILPMAVAWQVAARRAGPVLGGAFPTKPAQIVGADLIAGSVMFGMGWALVGLCPGPALASIGFGGWGGVVFLCAMTAGIFIAPYVQTRLGWHAPNDDKRTAMDIRALTPSYAVSPQIDLADLTAIKAAGFTTVIDNRPDGEIPPHLHGRQMQAAAQALGLDFVINPVISGGLTTENITAQAAAVAASTGPVFAYCASGNRCSVVWALMSAGTRPTEDLIGIPARFGYNLEHLRGQLEAKATKI